MQSNKIGLNPMVLRQTAQSPFSHFDGSWEALLALAQSKLDTATPVTGRDGVWKITLLGEACARFFSSVVVADADTDFETVFSVRERAQAGERPFIHNYAKGAAKSPAGRVDLILYHMSVLTEEERRHRDGALEDSEWQIVSMNASADEQEQPPTPGALARNHARALDLPQGVGGTAAVPSAEDYMRSILYWQDKCMAR